MKFEHLTNANFLKDVESFANFKQKPRIFVLSESKAPEIDFYKYRSQFSVNRRGELSIQEEKAMELCIQKLLALQRSNIGHFKVALWTKYFLLYLLSFY